MKKFLVAALAAWALLGGAQVARADALDEGRTLLRSGQLEAAAQFFNSYAVGNPGEAKLTPEALAQSGRILDAMADALTGAAEKRCYWAKGGARSPECMQREAAALNARFGEGAFRYEHAILYLVYTGSHYTQLLQRFPKSPYAAEAEFYLLLRNLVGHPDAVLPRIKTFLAHYGSGPWHRRGLLLWARVNEDIWYIHRRWSWVLFNDVVSPDELVVRAEPYRQEALRTYEKLMKDKGTFEGAAAARAFAALSANQERPSVVSIVNDSNPGTLASWGVEAPAQVIAPQGQRAAVPQPAKPSPGPAAPQPKGPPPAAAPTPEVPAAPDIHTIHRRPPPPTPQRWQ
jgi:hypothetical protein